MAKVSEILGREPERDRYAEYLICKERGHKPGDMRHERGVRCRFCGTFYKERIVVDEYGAPEPPKDEAA